MQLTRHLDANATLVSLIEPLAPRRFSQTGLPGVQVLRASCDVARGPQIYEPSLMIMAQGSKLAFLGPRTLEYGAGHYLIQALPVPFECETFAMPDAPLLGVSVAIDRVLLGELVLAMGLAPGRHSGADPESMTSVVLDDDMRGCVERLLRCLHDPLDARFWDRRGCANCCSPRCAGRRPMCCAHWWNSRGSSPGSRRRSVTCMRITPSR
jgi:hypothetical protein